MLGVKTSAKKMPRSVKERDESLPRRQTYFSLARSSLSQHGKVIDLQVSDYQRTLLLLPLRSHRDPDPSSIHHPTHPEIRSQAMSRGGKLAPEVNRYVLL